MPDELTAACPLSGRPFSISAKEQELCRKLGEPLPQTHTSVRLRQLLAFWPQLALHKRRCDGSGRSIIAVFDEACPYPVWHREHWFGHAAPPAAEYDWEAPFFEQLWSLFQRCPIPHNIGLGSENCEYTDDWWYSRSCYLCHSGIRCEDCCYGYRLIRCRDCQYCVFCFDCELCRDLVNCVNCFSQACSFNCRSCHESDFLFDCRGCDHCYMCWNLRNQRFCIENVQYTQEEYQRRRAQVDLSSRLQYEQQRRRFEAILRSRVYWRALFNENVEGCSGAYLTNDRDCINCYFIQESQDCVNCFRGYAFKDGVDVISGFKSELGYCSCMPQVDCYATKYCYNVSQCKFMEYSGYCLNCQHCFACCGLVGKEYCILNRPYSRSEYARVVEQIRARVEAQGLRGQFFPGYFAPNCYDESLAALHFPLSQTEQQRLGFRVKAGEREREQGLGAEDLPERAREAASDICKLVFWDGEAQRPFRVSEHDLAFAMRRKLPLPHQYYASRLKQLFAWMYCDGALRQTICALTGAATLTSLPAEFDGRIVSEQAYSTQLDG
jgi:hypothetical protein